MHTQNFQPELADSRFYDSSRATNLTETYGSSTGLETLIRQINVVHRLTTAVTYSQPLQAGEIQRQS
jgi:hypothetical protein